LVITGGNDGCLYIWYEKKVIKKQNAHENQPILCLKASKLAPIFVSGGMDGNVILWEISNISGNNKSIVLEKFVEYSLINYQDEIFKPCY
jgi:WD40 repeat protein